MMRNIQRQVVKALAGLPGGVSSRGQLSCHRSHRCECKVAQSCGSTSSTTLYHLRKSTPCRVSLLPCQLIQKQQSELEMDNVASAMPRFLIIAEVMDFLAQFNRCSKTRIGAADLQL